MEPFEYTTRGQTYRITPLEEFEPRTGDNTGLSFSVQSNIVAATPTIRVSRTLEAIWGIRDRGDLRDALIQLGNLKIAEAIERGEELRYLDFMFISQDPIIRDTLALTVENLQNELREIQTLNQSRTYEEKRQRLTGMISSTFGLYEEINAVVRERTGNSAFTTTVSGTIQTNLADQQVRTVEEYHWALMLTSLPFEAMDLSRLDPNFPTDAEQRVVREGIANLAGAKEDYFYVGTIKALAQARKLIRELDGSDSPQVGVLRAVHGLRNTYPTHTNQQYIEHRRSLGLPDAPPGDGGTDGTAYIDEMLSIYEQLNAALETLRDKIRVLASRQ